MDATHFETALRPLLSRSAGYAFAMLRERKEAEDAVQQAALRAWERRGQIDDERPFKAWWFGILRNHCLDRLRARKRAPMSVALDRAELSEPADESALDRRALTAAMEQLPDGQRDVLRLRYFGEFSYQEISEILRIPSGTVMSRLHLARKALAQLIRTENA